MENWAVSKLNRVTLMEKKLYMVTVGKNPRFWLGVRAHAFNLNTEDTEAS